MKASNDFADRRTLLRGIGRLGLSLTAIGVLDPCSSIRALETASVATDDVQGKLHTMNEFVIWRRLDRPGHDAVLLKSTEEGWLLSGSAVFNHDAGPACINYSVAVDSLWKSRRGTVKGFVAGNKFSHVITRASDGGWYLNDTLIKGLEHLRDLDYGFTPATNVLQLRRVAIPVGKAVDLPVVWFDAEATTLIELPQRYERLSETTYLYSAPSVGYHGELELLSRNGFVKSYARLWTVETSTGPS
jgi:uncharacterized protein